MARRGQKKVVVWKYEKDTAVLDVPVYMVVGPDKGYTGRTEDEPNTYFKVELTDPDVSEEDPNIDELKKRVWAELDKKLAIKWADYLHVEVDGEISKIVRTPEPGDEEEYPQDRIDGSGRCQISVKYTRLQLGEVNGMKMQRDFNNSDQGKSYYDRAHQGWPDVGPAVPRNKWSEANEMRSLVPDTPENRAALDAIADGFECLMQKLRALLAPEHAEKTLANVGNLKLLPGPK